MRRREEAGRDVRRERRWWRVFIDVDDGSEMGMTMVGKRAVMINRRWRVWGGKYFRRSEA